MFIVKTLGLGVWLLLVSAAATVIGIFFPRNPGLNRFFFSTYAKGAFAWLGLKVEASHVERLSAFHPCIYMSNHQSGIDMATVGSLCPTHTLLIGKKELMWLPFFGSYFWLAGNVFIDRKNRHKAVHSLAAAVKAMRERKWSLAIFPEGTRNTTGEPLLPFKKGGFHVAIETQLPIIPLVCAPVKEFVSFGDNGVKILKPGTVRVSVLEPIPTAGLTLADLDSLVDRVRSAMLQGLEKFREKSSI